MSNSKFTQANDVLKYITDEDLQERAAEVFAKYGPPFEDTFCCLFGGAVEINNEEKNLANLIVILENHYESKVRSQTPEKRSPEDDELLNDLRGQYTLLANCG